MGFTYLFVSDKIDIGTSRPVMQKTIGYLVKMKYHTHNEWQSYEYRGTRTFEKN